MSELFSCKDGKIRFIVIMFFVFAIILFSTNFVSADTTPPVVIIDYPLNQTYSGNVSELNYSITDDNPFESNCTCHYSRDNGITNSTPIAVGTNFTNVISNDGFNNWTLWCNDTSANENITAVSFVKAGVEISSCKNITIPGYEYKLINDIIDSGEEFCIIISADNVTLDCQGYNIDGDGTMNADEGIQISDRPGVPYDTNVTVKNCNLTDWNYYGIKTTGNDNVVIDNVSVINEGFCGIGIFSSSYSNLTNSEVFTVDDPLTSYGVYFHLSDNLYMNSTVVMGNSSFSIVFSDAGLNSTIENVTIAKDFGWDIHFTTWYDYDCQGIQFKNVIGSDNKTIFFHEGSSVNINGWDNVSAIYLCNASNSIINNVTMAGGNINGIWILPGSNNVNISNSVVTDRFDSINIYKSNETFVRDTNLSGGYHYDIYGQTQSQSLVFLNCSYDFNSVISSNANFTRLWYYSAYAKDTSDNPLEGVNVTGYDSSGDWVFSVLTDSTGYTPLQEVRDYYDDGTTLTYFSNYSINMSLSGTNVSNPYNATLDNNVYGYESYSADFVFEESNNITECRKLGLANENYTLVNDISSTGTCINITAENVTLDGDGYLITYGNSTNGYGIYSFNKDKITIKNVSIYMKNETRTDSSAIYLQHSNNHNISFVNISITGNDDNIGVYLFNASDSYIDNAIINTTGEHGYGIFLYGVWNGNCVNNTVTNSEIYTYGTYGSGIRIVGANGASKNHTILDTSIYSKAWSGIFIEGGLLNEGYINITRVRIETESAAGDGQGIHVWDNINLLYVKDSNITTHSSSDGFKVRDYAGNYSFLNVSYVNDSVVDGTLTRKWYFESYVNWSNGTLADGANVSAYNSSGDWEFNVLTDSAGYIPRQEITDYIIIGGTGTSYFSNYTINASKTGINESIVFNVTLNQNKYDYVITLNGTLDYFPTVTLNKPDDNEVSTSLTQLFNCTGEDDFKLVNITLYIWNSSSQEVTTITNYVNGTLNQTNWTYSLPYEDDFVWNCYASDNATNPQSAFASANFTLEVIQNASVINSLQTSISPVKFYNNITLTANVSFGNNTYPVYCNFTLAEPSGNLIIDNVNGTIFLDQLWNATIYHLINETGNWTGNLTCENAFGLKRIKQFSFNVTDVIEYVRTDFQFAPDTSDMGKNKTIEMYVWHDTDETFEYNITAVLNDTYLPIIVKNVSVNIGESNRTSPILIILDLFINQSTPIGEYYGNITLTRLNKTYTPIREFIIPVYVGVNPPAGKAELYVSGTGTTPKCQNLENGECYFEKISYANVYHSAVYDIINTGGYKLSNCTPRLLNNNLNAVFSTSSFDVEPEDRFAFTVSYRSAVSATDNVYVYCESATALGYNTSSDWDNNPIVKLNIISGTEPTSQTGESSSGGPPSAPPPSEVVVVALQQPEEDLIEYTDLERAILYARIREAVEEYKTTELNILRLGKVQDNLKNNGIEIDTDKLRLWIKEYEDNQLENVVVKKTDADKYNLFIAFLIVAPLEINIEPKNIIMTWVLRKCFGGPEEFKWTSTSNMPLQSCRAITTNKTSQVGEFSCEIRNETVVEVAHKLKRDDFFTRVLEGTIVYNSQQNDTYFQEVRLTTYNICRGPGLLKINPYLFMLLFIIALALIIILIRAVVKKLREK